MKATRKKEETNKGMKEGGNDRRKKAKGATN